HCCPVLNKLPDKRASTRFSSALFQSGRRDLSRVLLKKENMISEKQLEANRRNALHSTGPKTAEGKAQSSRNNLRHGLTGQISLLPTEDRAGHDAFCDELIGGFQPETPM